MSKTRTTLLAALILCVAASSALGRKVWYWTLPYLIVPEDNPSSMEEYYLTGDNGSHAVAMTKYSGGTKLWTSILATKRRVPWDWDDYVGRIQAYEYKDIGNDWRRWDKTDMQWPFEPSSPIEEETLTVNCHVANNSLYKTYTWGNMNRQVANDTPAGYGVPSRAYPLSYQGGDWWDNPHPFSNQLNDSMAKDMGVAVALFNGPNDAARSRGVAVWTAHQYDSLELRRAITTDGGATWPTGGGHYIVSIEDPYADKDTWWTHASLATDDVHGENAYLAYESTAAGPGHIVFRRSTDWGHDWSQDGTRLGYGTQPCIAAVGDFVFVGWKRFHSGTSSILYRYSTNNGTDWSDPTDTVPFQEYPTTGTVPFVYELPSVAAVPLPDQTHPGVLVVARLRFPFDHPTSTWWWTTRGMFAHFDGTTAYWQKLMPLCTDFVNNAKAEPLNPSIAAVTADGLDLECLPPWADPDAMATCVMSTPAFYRRPLGYGHHIRKANGYYADRSYDPAPDVSTARLLAMGSAGAVHYGGSSWPYVATGQVMYGAPIHDFGVTGKMPALAVDADGCRWVAYVEQDTLWCYGGYGDPSVVFAGSSSAVPGQPSIVCYPDQANGVYVGNVVFPVYDTAGASSMVMYARVDTTGVVLDTIESVANLGDSLPCVNVYLSDSLVVTWQHGDSTLSALLADYGPGTSGQPPAWSSPSLVTASGCHPMSVMENGCVLNCDYTQQNNGYSIQRATCDLSGGGMFGNWVAMTPPSVTSNVEKGNPVYAGVGCSVWQQMSGSGKWVIKGFVRGEETTLVANDTDAYHPHAVAESSGSSPSVDLIRLHLLYDAGVAFEVDSGVFDTGQVRYAQFDFPVSHAGSDATRANNGSKLVRKEGSDSLFATYQDADGTVMYAYSAAGDSWQREIVATERSYPAIAADSTGKRWVVAQTGGGSLPMAQYLYYRSGGSWTPQTLYSIFAPLGPASLAGASSTTTGIAYAAFRVVGVPELIVLTKFDGTNVAACTVATGTGLGDPAVTVEPYTADSDYVHVTWEDAGVIKYRMDTDGRSSAIANNWTAVVTLSDAQATSHHPVISADRDRIVAAWAQGATADIYSRKRSTDSTYNNWEAALNLSNTANDASDWPTIALGDTVVVAWQEARTGGSDFDILACIDFGDTLNVADNATVSGYPHVLFQNKASGDTCIPYLHTIWSETPSASYYEVGYDKLNLKQATGEGQQSAGTPPIPVKPSLSACRPNPFRDRTQINYALPTEGNVSLRVYDATGRTVRTLANGHQKAGSYSVTWDSKDNRGRQVPRGVYFYRLDTPGFRSVKKAVVTR